MKVFTVLLGLVISIVLFTIAYNQQNTSALIGGGILFVASAFLCYLVVVNWVDEKHKPIVKDDGISATILTPYHEYGIEWIGTEQWQVLANDSKVIEFKGNLGQCREWIKKKVLNHD